MKRSILINRHLSTLVASLGHLDEIVVADAGLPVPDGVPVIDLAVKPGVPGFWDVLDALRSELVIEAAVIADEANDDLQAAFADFMKDWSQETKKHIALSTTSHGAFKDRSARSKAVIRTGECTPYCNVILVSGVPF
ncbi:D-ribose pyranase [Paracoccus seriniphilus]|uniref:D-ribose pyranase n=1 Tax=Paracoccus seriniphilus TaxID=184748 RepID=A0A239PUG9_9RHOB|nr:D-ribose pyranase [Paracoccus seriniphilus]WCR16554.1 D-ribose pyranase [Paracoccus seriniphilus]SNT73768.1 ribose transport protein RbsD [Paracoccus seriniphilus]